MAFGGWLCLLAPLAGFLAILLAGTRITRRQAGILSTASVFVGFAGAVIAFVDALGHTPEDRAELTTSWTWLTAGEFRVRLELLIDPLSLVMMLVVTGIGGLIVLYSNGYMAGEDEERRYFAYMSFFVFAMLLLVEGGNLLLLLVGWGLVGLASYLLIGFHYDRPSAVLAAKKAFLMNALGDAIMALGLFLAIAKVGSLDYGAVFDAASSGALSDTTVTLIALGLLGGAVAKSAQIPLHTWLPDAMEGPTPVSALIHAATMVTAGVYLICRTHPVFEAAPDIQHLAALLGLATLLLAGVVALVQWDIKRVIAYSTMSQIGYMIVGVSIGAYSAGLFHLMTHAFFKALLFMAAGSIIAAMAAIQDIDRMRGFRRAMPFTCAVLICGALALAGFPGTSGFFSKDEILSFAATRGGMYWIFAVGGYLGAILTAFYSFRIVFRVVYGEPSEEARELEGGHIAHAEPINPATGEPEDTEVGFPGPEHHIAEREWPMKVAMAILAFGALFGGLIQIPGVTDVLGGFLEPVFEASPIASTVDVSTTDAYIGMFVGGLCSLLGIGAAFYMYMVAPGSTIRLRDRFRRLHDFLFNRWYFDELLDALVYRPVVACGR
ncbi:MAG TPA: NADH-quinone oxidoreductase subunit L, partial [Gaiella sp.]